MNEVRVTFSPHTADPQFLGEVAAAAMTVQFTVARAMWDAQIQVLQTMLTAQFTFLDTVCRPISRTR